MMEGVQITATGPDEITFRIDAPLQDFPGREHTTVFVMTVECARILASLLTAAVSEVEALGGSDV